MYTYVSDEHFNEKDELESLKAAYQSFLEKKNNLESFLLRRQFYCYKINDDAESEIIFISSEFHRLLNWPRIYLVHLDYEQKNFEINLFELQPHTQEPYYTRKGNRTLHEIENRIYKLESIPSEIEAWLTTIAKEELKKRRIKKTRIK